MIRDLIAKILLLTSIIVTCTQRICSTNDLKTDGVIRLIERVVGKSQLPLILSLEENPKETFFEYEVKQGKLHIRASSKVALCNGFYDFVKSNHYGLFTWSGNNIQLPSELPDCSSVYKRSPFKHNYYFNVVTYGYSTPYWNWERWEKEIDWMAFHGYDMPLSLIASEAIMAKVYKKYGFSENEINSYFTGAAHLPFLRMGLMDRLDGPLDNDWYERTISLQHKVLKRMRELGMKPICPAFAGFVPKEIKKHYPNVKVVTTTWSNVFHNWMISPEEKLFKEMGTTFIQEWEKEFGSCEYYIADSFNEMEIPFPPKEDPLRYELLAGYGNAVYQSIKNGNPNAVWVMQGWMFGFQRHIWDYNTLSALVRDIPKGKILLLDLAVDYNKTVWHSEVNWDFYKGFFGQPWIYSTIPNMGGKIGWTGNLDFYANGHLEVINSPNKGNLIGYGTAPEGIENNEVIYELLTDARWSNDSISLRDWLKSYSINRYGSYSNGLEVYWNGLLNSVYHSLEPHPRFNWQFRPGTVKKGTIVINDYTYQAIESLLADAEKFAPSTYYRADLAEASAMYIGGKLEILVNLIETSILDGKIEKADELEVLFIELMEGMDSLLASHPILRLDRWLDFATECAKTQEQKKQYIRNAKRIITFWGPPVDDYAVRLWSGVIRNYDLPRWRYYFAALRKQEAVDIYNQFEKLWVEDTSYIKTPISSDNIISLASQLIQKAKPIHEQLLSTPEGFVLGNWSKSDLIHGQKDLIFQIPLSAISSLKGICLKKKKGNDPIQIESLQIVVDGKNVYSQKNMNRLDSVQSFVRYKVSFPKDMKCNNFCTLKIRISCQPKANSTGLIFIENE